MVIKTILLGVSLLFLQMLLLSGSVFAEKVYRSVNEKGDVVYSSKPMEGATHVEPILLAPAPSTADVNAAKRRASGLQQAIKKSHQRKKERPKRNKAAAGEVSNLAEAEEKLRKAKVVLEGDWQFLAKGGRHLNAQYFARVKKAEAEYEMAKKRLR
ncbi:MAG: DUF4124 domain-containing protein [Candidatus Polarisedimenticolaceae bacterium]|nr:DUF4124 domain-containing protein [Candidatus Polarisedimenticolaceae bacterium]